MSSPPIIEIKHLTKRYHHADEPAVKNLDMKINRGEIFGLLGPNGAGKTTTISILCSQIKADEGEININGKNLATEAAQIKKIIGVVPQEIALYQKLTAYENLKFFGNMYGLKGEDLKDRIISRAKAFGLEQKLHRKVDTFSGGMKRRVNLMAGILHRPRILILDEPTVGIDVQSKNVIIEYLQYLNKNEETTIVYTSHLMEEAERFCTHIAILDMGKIVTEGKPEELISGYPSCNNLEDIFLLLTGRSLRD
ncbi:MAG: ABC transporter ATP-binding protein [Bacteroidetes bacterium]|nr:MAG: ABC transporter ATP-binding protein [Bacteroidota bacterium]RLD46231.1 MAG: ABC transporter ATP-binding protein [Bacteroidota bacterium]RLD83610.1 MAG: ABC transporter ATP-binding protein [Bacteroidota bacterium]HHL57471.1 ABC transporter ATP-binding protein [Bacteroidota bacterium]